MWKHYEVTIQFRDKVVGGIPKSKEMIEGWLKSRHMEDMVDQTVAQMGDQLDNAIDTMWTGFKKDENGLYIESRQIKAGLKEAANVIRGAIGYKGYMRARVAEKVFVQPSRIYLGVDEPSGWEEKPIHIMTRQGPRDALKRYDYVERPRITFQLKVLDDGDITEQYLHDMLEWLEEGGYGADRAQGMGKNKLEKLASID